MNYFIFFLIPFIFSCADMNLNDELSEKTDLMENFGISNIGVIENLPSEALVPSKYQVPHRAFLKKKNLKESLTEPSFNAEEFIHFPDEAFVHEEKKEEFSPFNNPIKAEKIEEKKDEIQEEDKEEEKEEELEVIYPVEVLDEQNLQQKPKMNQLFVLEEFVQKQRAFKSKKVDIVLVIDHTDSLKAEYSTLSKRIYELLDNYRDLEWNLGFLTAIYQNKKESHQRNLFWSYKDLSYKDQNIREKISYIFNSLKKDNRVACLVEPCPIFYPRLFDILESFLNKDLKEGELLRPQADYLSIIFVTDRDLEEKDHSVFKILKAYNYSFSSISIPSTETMPEQAVHECYQMRSLINPIANFSYYLNKLVVEKNGFIGDICEPYYIKSLLSKKNTLNTAFSLLKEPLVESMSVTIFPTQNKQIFWKTQRKKLYFNKPPSAGSVIEVLYESK